MVFLRSTLFSLSVIVTSVVITCIVLLFYFAPFSWRYTIISQFARYNLWVLKTVCKLDYVVEGRENIPDSAAIIFSKHQSTWETIALQQVFPPLTFVIKRELLWLPFFGWGLSCMDPIAINRSAGRNAIRQIIEQGTERLKRGLWVVIFPEGTRVPPGSRGRYKIGGAVFASKSGYPVVPVAHNAGYFWAKGQFLKKPGTIHMVIGPPIESQNKSAEQIQTEAETFIEGEMARLAPADSP
ncbi:lysophospholipid acyltransferase family protein [Thiohalophilus sp.]|uniref:lysophospholipid acyltransferase family protein n=1 Tax=Thiohalophilus sp. TaxID=3028392 RepID=UPI0039769CE6